MLRSMLVYAGGFGAFGVAYGLGKNALAGDPLAVDPGLVVAMAVTGAIGGYIVWRRAKR